MLNENIQHQNLLQPDYEPPLQHENSHLYLHGSMTRTDLKGMNNLTCEVIPVVKWNALSINCSKKTKKTVPTENLSKEEGVKPYQATRFQNEIILCNTPSVSKCLTPLTF